MSEVKIYKLQNNGDQAVIASCTLNDSGIVSCSGDKIFVDNLVADGIKNYENPEGENLFPKDGISFLKQLPNNFNSGYLNAVTVDL